MLGFDSRAARYTWTVALTVGLLSLVYLLRWTLFVFILALLLAYLISPLVNLVDRVLPTRTRTLALGLAYLIFLGILAVVGMQIGSRVVQQGTALAQRFPAMIAAWEQPSPNAPHLVNALKQQLFERAQAQFGLTSEGIITMLSKAGLEALSVARNLIFVVIVPILAFFFLKDANPIRNHILDMVEDLPNRALLDDLMADIHVLLVKYMRALVVLSLATFTAYSICFLILGVSYSILLAVLAAILEFIPMLGPLAAGVTIVAVAALSGSPVVTVIIFLLAYRMFQDYVLSPQLMGQGVELHPLLVLFGVFAGAELAGIPGSFLSVPVLALLRVVYLRFRKARLAAKVLPTPETTIPAEENEEKIVI